jgi:hypothetical protein
MSESFHEVEQTRPVADVESHQALLASALNKSDVIAAAAKQGGVQNGTEGLPELELAAAKKPDSSGQEKQHGEKQGSKHHGRKPSGGLSQEDLYWINRFYQHRKCCC